MELGRLAPNAYRRFPGGATVVWEPNHGIFRRGREVLPNTFLGLHTRPAWWCPSCTTVVIPPDPPRPPDEPRTPDRPADEAG